MYGLGIRIGLYLIWFAAILAYSFIHDIKDRTGLRDLNYWFCLAFLLSLIIDNKRNYLADSLIVVLLLASSTTLLTILEVIDHSRPRDNRRRRRRRGHPESHWANEFVRLFSLCAFVVYLNYWWFNGIYHTAKLCGLNAYYFTHLKRIRGSFRFVGQVWSPLLAAALLPVVIQFLHRAYRNHRHKRLGRERVAAAEGAAARQVEVKEGAPGPAPRAPGVASASSSSSDSSRRRHRSRKSKRGLITAGVLGILMLFLILHIEIMLAYSQNRPELNGVHDSAQLIPLLIGIGSLILVFWRLREQRKRVQNPRIPYFALSTKH